MQPEHTAPRVDGSISIVLLAYNEESEILQAIEEAALFAARHFKGHEIVVVDDGSTDGTRERVEQAKREDVTLLVHPQNRGMGAALRSGFAAARMDYIAPFPADRQVRPEVLHDFLPLLSAHRGVVGYYETPHTPGFRAVMSAVFARSLRWVAGLRVPFDGTYCFHRRWLRRVDGRRCRSESFVFSYELLNQLNCCGCELIHRPVVAHPRSTGVSRVANPRRIARVGGELIVSRLRGLKVATLDRLH